MTAPHYRHRRQNRRSDRVRCVWSKIVCSEPQQSSTTKTQQVSVRRRQLYKNFAVLSFRSSLTDGISTASDAAPPRRI